MTSSAPGGDFLPAKSCLSVRHTISAIYRVLTALISISGCLRRNKFQSDERKGFVMVHDTKSDVILKHVDMAFIDEMASSAKRYSVYPSKRPLF